MVCVFLSVYIRGVNVIKITRWVWVIICWFFLLHVGMIKWGDAKITRPTMMLTFTRLDSLDKVFTTT